MVPCDCFENKNQATPFNELSQAPPSMKSSPPGKSKSPVGKCEETVGYCVEEFPAGCIADNRCLMVVKVALEILQIVNDLKKHPITKKKLRIFC